MTGSSTETPSPRLVRYRSDCLLRSAGIPVATLHGLRMETSMYRSQSSGDGYDPDERFIEQVARICRETSVGEALAWQNPRILENNLTTLKVINNSKNRRRADALFAYVSRYVAKNDTIGFFGPLCWGTIGDSGKSSFVAHEPLLNERELYFESWAVDEIAQALAAIPGIFPHLPLIAHGTTINRASPDGGDADSLEETILALQGSFETIGELAAHLWKSDGHGFEDVALAIARLVSRGLLTCAPTPDVDEDGLRRLEEWVGQIADTDVRLRGQQLLAPFRVLRAELEHARGDADAVTRLQGLLADKFGQLTRLDAWRRAGEQYAGRGLVYEDSTRNLEFTIGEDYLNLWDRPLAVLLRAADWYIDLSGRAFERLAEDAFSKETAGAGVQHVSLERLFFLLADQLAHGVREIPRFVDTGQKELQRRWAVFARRAAEPSATIEGLLAVAEELFPASPEPWPGAHTHSPDIQLLAERPTGDGVQAVLGEVHVAMNSLEQPAFLRFAPHLDRIVREEVDAYPCGRVRMIPPRSSRLVSSRLSPPGTFNHPSWLSWTWGRTLPALNRPRVDASDLNVHRAASGHSLVVSGAGLRAPLLMIFADMLSMILAGTFALSPGKSSADRVELGGFVLSRRQWAIPMHSCKWLSQHTRTSRWDAFHEWRVANGLPSQFYWRVSDLEKPQLIDTAIPASVERLVTRARDAGLEVLRLTEALPSTDEAWLASAAGDTFSSEVRLVARLSHTMPYSSPLGDQCP